MGFHVGVKDRQLKGFFFPERQNNEAEIAEHWVLGNTNVP